MSANLETKTILLQKKLALDVITKNFLPKKIKRICGVDVSYRNDFAYCSAVILDKNNMNVIETKSSKLKSTTRYIPGLFMLKEAKPILHTLKKLEKSFDILLVDGNGQLHPRQCGLACYIGLKLDKPGVVFLSATTYGLNMDMRAILNMEVIPTTVIGDHFFGALAYDC